MIFHVGENLFVSKVKSKTYTMWYGGKGIFFHFLRPKSCELSSNILLTKKDANTKGMHIILAMRQFVLWMGKPHELSKTRIGEPQNMKHAYSCHVIIVWIGKPTLLETTNKPSLSKITINPQNLKHVYSYHLTIIWMEIACNWELHTNPPPQTWGFCTYSCHPYMKTLGVS